MGINVQSKALIAALKAIKPFVTNELVTIHACNNKVYVNNDLGFAFLYAGNTESDNQAYAYKYKHICEILNTVKTDVTVTFSTNLVTVNNHEFAVMDYGVSNLDLNFDMKNYDTEIFISDEMINFIKSAIGIVPKKDLREYLMGIIVHVNNDKLCIFVSDGHRGILGEFDIPPCGYDGYVNINIDVCKVFTKTKNAECKLFIDSSHCIFPTLVISTEIGDSFITDLKQRSVNYNAVLPTYNNYVDYPTLGVDIKLLKLIVNECVSLVTSKGKVTRPVLTISLNNGILRITNASQNFLQDIDEQLPSNSDVEFITLKIDLLYLHDMLEFIAEYGGDLRLFSVDTRKHNLCYIHNNITYVVMIRR